MSETAASQPDLNRIAALLNTMDRGALAIALCELPDLRAELMGRLRPLLTRPLHEVTLTAAASDPLELLRAAGVKPGEVVILSGLESAGEPALQRLEWSRESVWGLEANLLFWVTGEGQRSLLREAPNFYSRRTLLAQFTSAAPELLTLLYLDLVGSDQLMQDLGDEAFDRDVFRPFETLVRQQVGEGQGEVVTWIGTAVLASFREPASALRCAAALQQHLAEQPITTKSGPLRARASLHSGRPVRTERTLVGIDVIRTARLSHLAEGGHVLVSAETHALISADLPGLTFVPQTFAPERRPDLSGVFELLWEGQSQQSADHGAIPTNLPPRETLFAGRMEYLERLAKALPSLQPLLLTGPGGIGKTSLALEAAHSAYGARRFPGGVVWLRLEENPSLDSVISTLARALNVADDDSTLIDLYLSVDLAFRQAQCLLVLDGAEGAANRPELWNWLSELPETVSLLATARQPFLALAKAKLIPVDQLSPPDASALLMHLARQKAGVDWNSSENHPHLQRIAELCGSHPLALQIAAGFAASRTPAEIAAGLEQTEAPATDTPSLRTIEWAYRQLDEPSRRALAAASLFVDPFAPEALAAAAEFDSSEPILELLEVIGLMRSTHRQEQERHELHPLIREFTAAKLAALADADTIRRRFVDYYRRLVMENDDVNDLGKLARLDAEWRNALEAAQIAEQLQEWSSIDYLSAYLGNFLLLRGLLLERVGLNRRAVEAARAAQDRQAEGRALNNLGIVYEAQHRLDEAETCYQQSLTIRREHGDRVGEGQTLNNLGLVYQDQHRLDEAETCYQQSLTVFREHGDRFGEGQTLNNLGAVYQHQHRLDEAETCYQQSLTILREHGDRVGEGQTQENLALLHMAQGNLSLALDLERQALAVLETTQDQAAQAKARRLIATWEHQLPEEAPTHVEP